MSDKPAYTSQTLAAVELGIADVPAHWIKGQLLDLKHWSDGSFSATLMGDQAEKPETMRFDSTYSAQTFVSWWYSR